MCILNCCHLVSGCGTRSILVMNSGTLRSTAIATVSGRLSAFSRKRPSASAASVARALPATTVMSVLISAFDGWRVSAHVGSAKTVSCAAYVVAMVSCRTIVVSARSSGCRASSRASRCCGAQAASSTGTSRYVARRSMVYCSWLRKPSISARSALMVILFCSTRCRSV